MENIFFEGLRKYLPKDALAPIADYLSSHQIHLRVTNHRSSKLGDYRWPQHGYKYHVISINGDLPSMYFLTVLLHELAHYQTYIQYQTTVQPHGIEWQRNYRKLLQQYAHCYTDNIAPLLDVYISQLPLSVSARNRFENALRNEGSDVSDAEFPMLNNLVPGTLFALPEQGKLFRSIQKRRTRWICEEVNTGRKYTVSGTARVVVIDV
ncbi:MAG: SprT-like domain-containing protein [Bacteroidales bacterium]|nr:SprT-like domain-containing protein [Candidatus Colimorpha onthohippi]